jgi:hypothetical protein
VARVQGRAPGVAAVEDFAEQVGEQLHYFGWNSLPGSGGRVLIERDRQVADLPAGCLSDLADGLGEGQRPRAGQLVELARIPLLRQRGDRDVSDVVGIDERFGRVARREGHLAGEHGLEQEVLAEVLAEPSRPHDCQLGTAVAHRLLGELGLGFAAACEQDQAGNAAAHRQAGKGASRLDRAGGGQVRVVRNVRRPGTVQRGGPGGPVLPVERRSARP